jgi:hypothetical protein
MTVRLRMGWLARINLTHINAIKTRKASVARACLDRPFQDCATYLRDKLSI